MPEILQNIVADNRLENIRIVSENDDVIGGQPESSGNEQNDNNAIFDLACTLAHTLNKANQVPNPIKDQFVVGNTPTAYALFTVEEVRELIGINDDIPVGVIVEWDHEEAPKNWLLIRSQKFSATEYPMLAKLYPSLTLTDRRGVVSRGLDAGRGLDSGRVLGSYQADATQLVTGSFPTWATSTKFTGAFFGTLANMRGAMGSAYEAWSGDYDNSRVARTANEDRMKNIATNFIIKAK